MEILFTKHRAIALSENVYTEYRDVKGLPVAAKRLERKARRVPNKL